MPKEGETLFRAADAADALASGMFRFAERECPITACFEMHLTGACPIRAQYSGL
jgi:hypothetical protein